MIPETNDPSWQFLGFSLTAIGILVTYWIYWLQRQKKALAFGLVSSQRLLSVSHEVSSRVKVEFDGKPVSNVHLIVYALKNCGYRGIVRTDFEKRFRIVASEGVILSAEITSKIPSNLDAKIEFDENAVELHPLLLNVGDQLVFRILLSAPEPKLEVDARILDIPKLSPINTNPKSPPVMQSGLPMAFAFFSMLAVLAWIMEHYNLGHFFEVEHNASLSLDYPISMLFLGVIIWGALQVIIMRLYESYGPASRRHIDIN